MRLQDRIAQNNTIIYGIMCIVLLIDILQLWLLISTMNAYLGGDRSVLFPAAAVSIVCLALNAGLIRYIYRIEKVF
jgi:Family of unknown function (DUF6755)